LIYFASNSFAQSKLLGTYCVNQKTDHSNYSICNTFNKDFTFLRLVEGELGDVSYGNGVFKIKNDSLFLNYNTTKLRQLSYHKSFYFFNKKTDSVNVLIKITNENNEIIPNALVIDEEKSIKTRANMKGEIEFVFKRSDSNNEIIISRIGYDSYIFIMKTDKNYIYKVYLNETKGKPFKGFIDKFPITIIDSLNFNTIANGQVVHWKKNWIRKNCSSIGALLHRLD